MKSKTTSSPDIPTGGPTKEKAEFIQQMKMAWACACLGRTRQIGGRYEKLKKEIYKAVTNGK